MTLNPFLCIDLSISDSLRSVRKSVLIYETIIVRTLSSGIYTDHVFTEDGKEIAAVTLGSNTDREGKISLTLYNKEGKTTHTISQPMVDGDSIITGKDTVINETAYDINGNESAVTDGNGNVTT